MQNLPPSVCLLALARTECHLSPLANGGAVDGEQARQAHDTTGTDGQMENGRRPTERVPALMDTADKDQAEIHLGVGSGCASAAQGRRRMRAGPVARQLPCWEVVGVCVRKR